jgi:hypothetical protein
MATRNRSDLKSYFVKNAIPTEGNFADLIDSQLNQAQDGVFKPDGEALSVVAAPGAQKRALRLYASYPASNPDWMISLNPAQDPADAATARSGLGIIDGAGRTRLFIDAATGQIGVGTNAPQVALDVVGAAQANGFRGRYDAVLNDYRTPNPASNVCLQAPGNDRDAWIYRDPGDSANNWGIYHRQIDSAVGNLPGNSIGFVGGSGSQLQAYVNLADGSGYFAGPLVIGTAMTGGAGRLRVGAVGSTPGLYSEDSQDIVIGCAVGKTVHLGQLNKVTVQDDVLCAPGGLIFDGSAAANIDKGAACIYSTSRDVLLAAKHYLAIGIAGGAFKGWFDAVAGTWTCVDFYKSSDLRLKKAVEPVAGSLAKLRQLRGVSFEWNDRPPTTPGVKQLGFIAQEVQAVVHEAVVETRQELLAINYDVITVLLVEAIKEQQQQIDELRARSISADALAKTQP